MTDSRTPESLYLSRAGAGVGAGRWTVWQRRFVGADELVGCATRRERDRAIDVVTLSGAGVEVDAVCDEHEIVQTVASRLADLGALCVGGA